MLNEMYTVLFMMSTVMLAILVFGFGNRISIYYTLLFSAVLVTNLGYMQMSDAQELQTAVFANQTAYLGASFSPFFFLMCLSDLCKVKIKRGVQIGFLVFGGIVFLMTSTIGRVNWYYKDVVLVQKYGIAHLEKAYGPLHTFFPLYLFVVLVICLTMIISAMRRNRDVSYVTSSLLLGALVVIIVIYMVEKLLHLHLELIPIGYTFVQIEILFLLQRIRLYDVMAISSEAMERNDAYGFVVCDSNRCFLGGNEIAKQWFPELSRLSIDRPIVDVDSEFIQQLGNWISGDDEFETEHFEVEDKFIEARHSILKDKRRRLIHCISLRDDTKQQKYMQFVEQYNENLAKDVDEKTSKIRDIQDDIIISMASIVENRDNNTGGHIARTSDVVKIFVKHLREKGCCEQLTPEIARCIVKAAPLHDFGKIAIPDRILNKPGKFEPEEYEEMKKHSAKGAVIVARILQNSEDTQFKEIAVNVAHYHHEKWDGKGYPEGIKEEEIPFEARVMALADVFDALVSKRVYKDSFGYDRAFSIIEESCGTHFDPLLCKEFLICRPQLEELYNSYSD